MKTITVTKLYDILGKAIASGHGRKPVCVEKTTFQDNRESDGVTILDVCGAKIEAVQLADDDGGGAYNKDGSERTRTCIVLFGSAAERLG